MVEFVVNGNDVVEAINLFHDVVEPGEDRTGWLVLIGWPGNHNGKD
jgi:hypothetical protein